MSITEGQASAAKAGSVWGFWTLGELLNKTGIHTWSDAASAAAFILSCLFILDWLWKRIVRHREPQDDKSSK